MPPAGLAQLLVHISTNEDRRSLRDQLRKLYVCGSGFARAPGIDREAAMSQPRPHREAPTAAIIEFLRHAAPRCPTGVCGYVCGENGSANMRG
jgi:hypothetical protein